MVGGSLLETAGRAQLQDKPVGQYKMVESGTPGRSGAPQGRSGAPQGRSAGQNRPSGLHTPAAETEGSGSPVVGPGRRSAAAADPAAAAAVRRQQAKGCTPAAGGTAVVAAVVVVVVVVVAAASDPAAASVVPTVLPLPPNWMCLRAAVENCSL